jgi:hypothetical protein
VIRRPRVRPWLAAAVALLAGGSALAYQFITTSSGKPLKWPSSAALMHTDPGNFGSLSVGGVGFRQAAISWNAVPGSAFRFSVADGAHAGYGLLPVDDGYNDVQLINLSLGSGVLAVTYFYSFGYDEATGHLRDVDVDFTTTETYDYETVALHEQGHVLGLAHTSDVSAVMFPYYTGVYRVLAADDRNGVVALYPASSGGGSTTVLPPGLPTLGGVLDDLSASATQVEVGDPLEFSCTVGHDWPSPIFLQALYTEPRSYGPFPEITVPPGTPYPITRTLTISEVPGLYDLSAEMIGSDGSKNYRAAGTGAVPIRVTRPPAPLPLADRLVASLGPSGQDRVELLLAKGTRFTLELQGDPDEGMFPGLQVTDPSGRPFAWKPGKTLRAKSAGVHVLAVTNTTENLGTYRLFTDAIGTVKAGSAKTGVSGGGTVEVPLALFARTEGILRVKGPKALDLRITGLRSPSGVVESVVSSSEVAIGEVGEDGTWTILVESGTGGTGSFKVGFSGTWITGDVQTL